MSAQGNGMACWSVGRHAEKNILPAITQCGGLWLTGIATRNTGVREKLASLYSCKSYSGPEEMLADPEVAAVYLAGPNGVHAEQIRRCLEAKKSVLVEKTALPTLAEAESTVRSAEESGLLVMEAFMFRFHPQFLKLVEILEEKKYGEVLSIEANFGFPHLDATDIRYRPELAGGALNDAGAYTVCASRILLGGDSAVCWKSLASDSGYAVDTSGQAIIRTHVSSFCCWGFGVSYRNELRVWCEDGIIVVDRAFSKPVDFSTTVAVHRNGQILELHETGASNHFIRMLGHFATCLASGERQDEHRHLLSQARLLEKIRSVQ